MNSTQYNMLVAAMNIEWMHSSCCLRQLRMLLKSGYEILQEC
jgi:hypothetical protein